MENPPHRTTDLARRIGPACSSSRHWELVAREARSWRLRLVAKLIAGHRDLHQHPEPPQRGLPQVLRRLLAHEDGEVRLGREGVSIETRGGMAACGLSLGQDWPSGPWSVCLLRRRRLGGKNDAVRTYRQDSRADLKPFEGQLPNQCRLVRGLSRFSGHDDLIIATQLCDDPTPARGRELSAAVAGPACHCPAIANGTSNRWPL